MPSKKKSKNSRQQVEHDAAESFLAAAVVEEAPAVETEVLTDAAEPAEDLTEAAMEQPTPEKKVKAKSAKAQKEPKPKGIGVGARAKELILARPELSFQQIADLVREELPAAKITANSARWYAMDMRKKGIEVPDRASPALGPRTSYRT
ncbi:hypothetical protein [Vulgatibacter sp.]|uniref:hypothetical protein n=1 Tax=Vulgatibacter sp. TaxID=1971226 RepID=UPI0035650DF6